MVLTKESSDDLKVAQIPIIYEFQEVFPKDVTSLPLKREVEFSIDVVARTTLVSVCLCRMAPLEQRELKDQLEELLMKHFIRPSVTMGSSSISSKEEGWWYAIMYLLLLID